MTEEKIKLELTSVASAAPLLASWNIVDIERAWSNLVAMQSHGLSWDLVANLCEQLTKYLPRLAHADMALNNLERFVAAARNPLGVGAMFERDPETLTTLLQIFSTSQYLSDLLVSDPESYDLLRLTEGEPVAREVLAREFVSEIFSLPDDKSVILGLRRIKRRETLRIGYGDLVRGFRLQVVTRQISYLAEAILEAALQVARRNLEQKRGVPLGRDGEPAKFVVLALGKLGGMELNYSSDIDLMFLYDHDGHTTQGRAMTNREFFERLAREVVRLLTEVTSLGIAYRVDLRLRPGGRAAPMVTSFESARSYYDLSGRTWERQAFVKARPVAGDIALGYEFLNILEPWIYRRYLSRADIGGIRALKRRIEHRTRHEGDEHTDVKSGHGGIRDIEFVIQFLQLLNGGDIARVRTTNTLDAIVELENAGCLTNQERILLEEHYTFLRNIEHRLQMMFDLQTHTMPREAGELQQLALRLNYKNHADQNAMQLFMADYKRVTELNRKILDHLLHDAFDSDEKTEPEIDLVLDPDPNQATIQEVLSKHGFKDTDAAYQNLLALSQEKVRFLAPRRCRHFLASIAPRLLSTISATSDADATLRNLTRVSDSLGGKAVLWELFSENQPTMELYVELCASSPFLCDVLTTNPGMIDELLDSLLLDRLPSLSELREQLAEVTRAAENTLPILQTFRNSEKLRVGVRDILNKEPVQNINHALSNIAEALLTQITRDEYQRLVKKYGVPMSAEEGRGEDGEKGGGEENTKERGVEPIIVALGKFGGAELNYHSDLDLLFLYEADGGTFHVKRTRQSSETTSNLHFFSELAQRIVKVANEQAPFGRLYQIDSRLRPTGKSGRLATGLAEFERYFKSGEGQLWERQALCRARVVYCPAHALSRVERLLTRSMFAHPWQPHNSREIFEMRLRMQEGASERNLKRGPGGVVDIEFLVQMLQLKYGVAAPKILNPNTLDALNALHAEGYLNEHDFDYLTTSYQVLRSIQGRLRLMNMSALNELPKPGLELAKLSRLLGYSSEEKLLSDCRRLQHENRTILERFVNSE